VIQQTTRNILVIGTVWPERNASAAGVRMWGLLRCFQRAGWRISYFTPAKEDEFTLELRAEGIDARSTPSNHSSFDELLARLQPEVVLFDRFVIEEKFGWRVARVCPAAVRVLDTVDLHFLRRARQRSLREGQGEISALDLETTDQLRELSSIYRSDLTLVLSDFELDLLAGLGLPSELLKLLRIAYPEPRVPTGVRRDFVFFGGFRHAPNVDAVHWLKREIWPLIRERLPAAELHIYGAYPPREIGALDDGANGFRISGWAEDQYETLSRYRVNLAPLRFGAGIKGKISDGWLVGTPAVATSIGAEGMHGALPFGGRIADGAQAFAAAACELYQSTTGWESESRAGLELIRKLYNETDHDQSLLGAIETAHVGRDARRSRNLVGRMLGHHLHRSTEYFSRWIELKEAGERHAQGNTDVATKNLRLSDQVFPRDVVQLKES
jgi:glycosyltransferase involved in cell wall biosynthesis